MSDEKALRESIAMLRRQEKNGEARLKLVRDTIANLQRILVERDEPARASKSPRSPRKKAKELTALTLGFAAPPAPSQLPTVTAAILKGVDDAPGLSPNEMITRLFDTVATESADKRKLLSTRIGQLEKKGRIRKQDGRLYPVSNGNGAHE